MLELVQTYSKEAFSLAVVVFGFAINHVFRLRPKLVYSIRHSSNYIVDEPLKNAEGKVIVEKQIVRTASIVAENDGLQPAKDVEFTFNWKPLIYTVYPGRAFTTEITGMDRWTLRLPSLAPKEVFAVELMSINQELPNLTSMRSDETEGKRINMVPRRETSRWFNGVVFFLFFVGTVTTLYLVALLIEWLAR